MSNGTGQQAVADTTQSKVPELIKQLGTLFEKYSKNVQQNQQGQQPAGVVSPPIVGPTNLVGPSSAGSPYNVPPPVQRSPQPPIPPVGGLLSGYEFNTKRGARAASIQGAIQNISSGLSYIAKAKTDKEREHAENLMNIFLSAAANPDNPNNDLILRTFFFGDSPEAEKRRKLIHKALNYDFPRISEADKKISPTSTGIISAVQKAAQGGQGQPQHGQMQQGQAQQGQAQQPAPQMPSQQARTYNGFVLPGPTQQQQLQAQLMRGTQQGVAQMTPQQVAATQLGGGVASMVSGDQFQRYVGIAIGDIIPHSVQTQMDVEQLKVLAGAYGKAIETFAKMNMEANKVQAMIGLGREQIAGRAAVAGEQVGGRLGVARILADARNRYTEVIKSVRTGKTIDSALKGLKSLADTNVKAYNSLLSSAQKLRTGANPDTKAADAYENAAKAFQQQLTETQSMIDTLSTSILLFGGEDPFSEDEKPEE